MSKESFVIYKEFYPAIEPLTDEQLGRLFRSLFKYQREGLECEQSDIKMAFMFFKNQFRLDDEKYEATVNRNKTNGLKGGRPPKPTITEPNPNNPVGFQKPKKADKEKEKDKEKDIILPFSSPEFIATWNMLMKEKEWKKKTQNALRLALNKLNGFDEKTCIQMIESTIEKGWKSFYPPNNNNNHQAPSQSTLPFSMK